MQFTQHQKRKCSTCSPLKDKELKQTTTKKNYLIKVNQQAKRQKHRKKCLNLKLYKK